MAKECKPGDHVYEQDRDPRTGKKIEGSWHCVKCGKAA
jgi:hypothetical protein